MKSQLHKITCPDRLDDLKTIIVNERKTNLTRASYELYGITFVSNRAEADRVEYAPTSADFSPMSTKARVAGYLKVYDMVAEFRGAWKSDDEAKVVGYDNYPEA